MPGDFPQGILSGPQIFGQQFTGAVTFQLSLSLQQGIPGTFQGIQVPAPGQEATFGSSGVTLCLQIIPFLCCYFGQESIEDLCVKHLDLLHPQPGQLEASLRHPTGVVLHGNLLL